jgi:DNA-binding transcriptional ArsR family regulator
MMKKPKANLIVSGPDQRAALASPLRLEIIGLFTNLEPLSIADMAELMGRTAGSLYHHVSILEKAGLLRRTGSRPKGKRHEALFGPVASRIELDAPLGDADAAAHAVKAIAAAFRMTERDLEAALQDDTCVREGPQRNLVAGRLHMRASPEFLAKINKHLEAIIDLLQAEAAKAPSPGPDDQHLSLTLALLPLKGRGKSEIRKGG